MKNMNVNALVKLLGINANTLRGWERRYKAVNPKRGEDGRRTYSAQDVERVRCLWELVKKGYAIGTISQTPTAQLKKMLEQGVVVSKPVEHLNEETEKIDQIIAALENFDLERLNLSLQKARFQMSILDLINNLLLPLMTKVGFLVIENKLSISQEHLLSSMLRDYLGGIHQSLSPYELSSRPASKSIIICTREGDIHEFGILISAILCNLYRYKSYFLGPNMPLEDVVEAADRFKADAVLVGLMRLPKKSEVVATYDFISELDGLLPKKVALILGGSDLEEVKKIKTSRKTYLIQKISDLEKVLSLGV